MKAIRRRPGGPELETNSPDPRAAGEAIVRPVCVGLNELDFAVAAGRGPESDFDGVLGTQFVGVVEEVAEGGSGDHSALVGARVAASPDVVCAACDMCRAGLSAHCRERRTIGAQGRDGALAERIALPVGNLVPIPEGLTDDAALFAVDVASVAQAIQQIRLEGKPYITILGDSAPALIAAQVMSRLNASVRLVGWSEARLERCVKWGVKHRPIDDVGRRADQDIIIDCTASAAGFSESARMVRPRGKVLLKSLGQWSAARAEPSDLAIIISKELEIIGSRLGPLSEGMGMLASGEVDTAGLTTRRIRLDEVPGVLGAPEPVEQVRIVVDM